MYYYLSLTKSNGKGVLRFGTDMTLLCDQAIDHVFDFKTFNDPLQFEIITTRIVGALRAPPRSLRLPRTICILL